MVLSLGFQKVNNQMLCIFLAYSSLFFIKQVIDNYCSGNEWMKYPAHLGILCPEAFHDFVWTKNKAQTPWNSLQIWPRHTFRIYLRQPRQKSPGKPAHLLPPTTFYNQLRLPAPSTPLPTHLLLVTDPAQPTPFFPMQLSPALLTFRGL